MKTQRKHKRCVFCMCTAIQGILYMGRAHVAGALHKLKYAFFPTKSRFWAVRTTNRAIKHQKTDNIFIKKVLTKGEEGDILSKSLREGHVRVKDEEIPA